MSVWRRNTIIASGCLSLSLLLTSCNDTKASQCQRLIAIVNNGTSLLETNKATQVSTSLKLARDLADVAKKIREQNFKDPKLAEFQSNFVKVFVTVSENLKLAAQALGSSKLADASPSGREKIQKARDEIDTALKAAEDAGKQSDILAGQVNKYCSQNE